LVGSGSGVCFVFDGLGVWLAYDTLGIVGWEIDTIHRTGIPLSDGGQDVVL
jgi:hypothetical protein